MRARSISRACRDGARASAREYTSMMMMISRARFVTVATVSATSAVSDVARVERAVRRVNRRVSRAVESFSVESDDGARDRAVVGGRDARRGTRDAGARRRRRALVWFHGYGDVDGESWREFCEVVVAAVGRRARWCARTRRSRTGRARGSSRACARDGRMRAIGRAMG